ncbi:MAG TPA: VCBS repeat-containing protein [Pirellulales bacterium]|nr:VCBS repeat-containing protein [Pirellulales bacterium]
MKSPFPKHWSLASRPLAVLIFGCYLAGCGCNDSSAKRLADGKGGRVVAAAKTKSTPAELAGLTDAQLEARIGPEIQVFCGRCHVVPEASEAPREEWRREVEQAFQFHKSSPRASEPAPDLEAVAAYFERKAIPYADFKAPPLGDPNPGRLRFKKTEVAVADSELSPAIAGLTWIGPQQAPFGVLLACEMGAGALYSISPSGELGALVPPGSKALFNPCHVEPCDLDGDGAMDLVVADLGNFYPTDLQFGRVVWLRRNLESGGYEPIDLAAGLGRVADAQPADFDGDGDQDLIVAEFGWHETGRILLLKNQGFRGGRLTFEQSEIDPRHGAIHVPVVDLNGDGKPDFAALISQEHEIIEAFLNRGDGTFQKRRIYSAPNPSWGSSGIQLVDIDADGDFDVLYSNGDSFDRNYLKPYHALRWLENQGRFPWIEHHLMDMPGCQRALAGDLDRDGDLDIVAVALLPNVVLDRFGAERFDSVCWLEQIAPGEFQRRTLEASACRHAALAMDDFDADGDLDLAVGSFEMVGPNGGFSRPLATIWWNETELSPLANPNQ